MTYGFLRTRSTTTTAAAMTNGTSTSINGPKLGPLGTIRVEVVVVDSEPPSRSILHSNASERQMIFTKSNDR